MLAHSDFGVHTLVAIICFSRNAVSVNLVGQVVCCFIYAVIGVVVYVFYYYSSYVQN